MSVDISDLFSLNQIDFKIERKGKMGLVPQL